MTPERSVLDSLRSILRVCLKLRREETLDILSETLTLADLEELKARWQ